MKYIEPLARLIAEFGKLPSVGEKTAARYAYAILEAPSEDVDALIDAAEAQGVDIPTYHRVAQKFIQ